MNIINLTYFRSCYDICLFQILSGTLRNFRGFIEHCPSGALTKEGIMQMYLMPRSQAKVFIDEMFMLFDADGNGTVSFKVRDQTIKGSVNYDFEGICFGNQHD